MVGACSDGGSDASGGGPGGRGTGGMGMGGSGTGGLPNGCDALTTLDRLTIEATATEAEVNDEVRCVERIEGELKLDQVTAANLSFPALRYAGKLWVQGGTGLTSVAFPVLEKLGGRMAIYSTKTLATVDMPALSEIQNDVPPSSPDAPSGVSLRANEALLVFSLPSLTDAAVIQIEQNPALETVAFPVLTRVVGQYFTEACSLFQEGVSLWDNPKLASVNLPLLAEVEQGMLAVRDLDALQTLSLPAVTSVGTHFWVGENATLTTIDVPRLSSAGYLYVHDNPMLPASAVTTLEGQLSIPCEGYPWACDAKETCSGNMP